MGGIIFRPDKYKNITTNICRQINKNLVSFTGTLNSTSLEKLNIGWKKVKNDIADLGYKISAALKDSI